ncbi:hypothetical protein EIP86_001969 [Pleurotus ostreatoroseus]|nr:hypothetical protein EIP86_001969 [Pleurotus ostreatoroseus]
MYLLHRFSSFATTQSNIAVNDLTSGLTPDALGNAINRTRYSRKSRTNRHPLAVPSKKASPTVSLSNTVVSTECASTGSFGTLDLLLPSPAGLPEDAPQNFVPFPSSAPISLSCPSKYDDSLSCDLRPCSYTDAISHDTDLWPVDLRRKRAKSCLASSYVHRDAHCETRTSRADSFPSSQSDGYEPDTEARFAGPARKRRLAHSVRRAGGRKSLKGKEREGRRTGSIDVQFVATMRRSIDWQLKCAQDARRSRTCTGSSISDAYGGIAEDEDVEMGDSDYIAAILEQDKILVERLSLILSDQGFKPVRESELFSAPFLPRNKRRLVFAGLSPPHELMSAIDLAPRHPPLRLPSRPLPPLASPTVVVGDDDSLDSQFASIDRFQAPMSPPSPPMTIPFPSSRALDGDEEMSLASDPTNPLLTVMSFPCPPSAQLEPLVAPSSAVLPPSPPVSPSPTRPSHKRRHSHDAAVLDMPQLVACLIMRFNDRAATRPRSRAPRGVDGESVPRIGRSPLSTVAMAAHAELEL